MVNEPMTEDYSNFPSLNEAVEAIERLGKKVWPVFKEDSKIEEFLKEIDEILYSEFDIYLNVIQPMKTKNFRLPIFRVRELDAFDDIGMIREHSYPPANLVRFGRCNFPKRPVFYCSNNPLISLLEVIREGKYSNKKYCLSVWEIVGNSEDMIFQNFLQTDLHPENPFNILKKGTNENLDKSFEEKLPKDKKAGTQVYLKFLQNSFINDENYTLSASLAYKALFAPHNMRTDILLYPSVQARYKGVNMAINTNFVDQNMIAKRFYIIEVTDYNPELDSFEITFSRYGDISKNVILWRDVTPEDKKYEEYLYKDFGLQFKDFQSSFKEKK